MAGRVLIASRNEAKLQRAADEISAVATGDGHVATACLDNTNEAEVKQFFSELTESYDSLVVRPSKQMPADM